MKNILFISSYPFPLDKGSNQHAFFFIKALSAKFNVYCLFFAQPRHALPDDLDAPLDVLGIQAYTLCTFSNALNRGRAAAAIRRPEARGSTSAAPSTTTARRAPPRRRAESIR